MKFNADTKLIKWCRSIDDCTAIPVREFYRRDVILGSPLTRKQARKHEVWLELFGGDQNKLEDVVDRVFYEGNKRYKSNKMMSIRVPGEGIVAVERAWCVDDSGFLGFPLGIETSFGIPLCNLIGIVPEAPSEKTA